MPIFENLNSIKTREDGGSCDFNGYLEDYCSLHEDEESTKLLKEILEVNERLKIIVNLTLDIQNDVVTNRIIRYKDAFKVSKDAILYPFVIYGKNENNEERAIVSKESGSIDYILAKAMYYCMCEPNTIFDKARNEIIACTYKDIVEVTRGIFNENIKTGHLQRRLDQSYYATYDELQEIALAYSKTVKDGAKEKLHGLDEASKSAAIQDLIVTWFLLKKVLYVIYMMNKNFLASRHDNDIKLQRAAAKEVTDKVEFYSYSELWKL